jgi:hypothetical protein
VDESVSCIVSVQRDSFGHQIVAQTANAGPAARVLSLSSPRQRLLSDREVRCADFCVAHPAIATSKTGMLAVAGRMLFEEPPKHARWHDGIDDGRRL